MLSIPNHFDTICIIRTVKDLTVLPILFFNFSTYNLFSIKLQLLTQS